MKFNASGAGILEVTEKGPDNFLPSDMVASSELVDLRI